MPSPKASPAHAEAMTASPGGICDACHWSCHMKAPEGAEEGAHEEREREGPQEERRHGREHGLRPLSLGGPFRYG